MLVYGTKKAGEPDLAAMFNRAYAQIRQYGELHNYFMVGPQPAESDKIHEEHNLENGGRAYQIMRRQASEFYIYAGNCLARMASPSRLSAPVVTIEKGAVADFMAVCARIGAIVEPKIKAERDAVRAKQFHSCPLESRQPK